MIHLPNKLREALLIALVLVFLVWGGLGIAKLIALAVVVVVLAYIANPALGLYLATAIISVHTIWQLPQLPLLGYSDVYMHEAVIAFCLLLFFFQIAMHRFRGDMKLWKYYIWLVILTLPGLHVGLKNTVWHNYCFRAYMLVLFVGATLMPQLLEKNNFRRFYRFYLFTMGVVLVYMFGKSAYHVRMMGTLAGTPFYGSGRMTHIICLLVVWVAAVMEPGRAPGKKMILSMVLGAVLFLTLGSGGRGTSIVLLLALGVTWLGLSKDAPSLFGRLSVSVVSLVVLIGMLTWMGVPIVERFLKGYARTFIVSQRGIERFGDTAAWRMTMYRDAFQAFTSKPITGVGWGGTIIGTSGHRFYRGYTGSSSSEMTDTPSHIHSVYLGILSASGLSGALGFVLFAAYCTRKLREGLAGLSGDSRRVVRALILGSTASFAMLWSTNGLMGYPQNVLYFLFIGLWLRLFRFPLETQLELLDAMKVVRRPHGDNSTDSDGARNVDSPQHRHTLIVPRH